MLLLFCFLFVCVKNTIILFYIFFVQAVGDFDDEWDPENVKQNVQRKRGRPRKGSLTTADTNESDDTSTKNPRKTSTKHKKTITMQNKLMSLMDRVIKYTAEYVSYSIDFVCGTLLFVYIKNKYNNYV